ncbi:MAG: hypothetical protein KAZ85_00350 [Gammaproteobacteria bacterium]|nr:hypothetical protein [Gammaproteobacteria bacterium]
MQHNTEDSGSLNLAVPVELLARLFAEQQLCAADVLALDSASHQQLHRLMLTVCAQQLKGAAKQCDACASQATCQQISPTSRRDIALVPMNHSIRLQ